MCLIVTCFSLRDLVIIGISSRSLAEKLGITGTTWLFGIEMLGICFRYGKFVIVSKIIRVQVFFKLGLTGTEHIQKWNQATYVKAARFSGCDIQYSYVLIRYTPICYEYRPLQFLRFYINSSVTHFKATFTVLYLFFHISVSNIIKIRGILLWSVAYFLRS